MLDLRAGRHIHRFSTSVFLFAMVSSAVRAHWPVDCYLILVNALGGKQE